MKNYYPEALLALSIANVAWYPDSWLAVVTFITVFSACACAFYFDVYRLKPAVVIPFDPTELLTKIAAQEVALNAAGQEIEALTNAVNKLSLAGGFKTFTPRRPA